MIYGYARVSTKGQGRDGNSLEVQESSLRTAGATIIYTDMFTGADIKRPEFEKLLKIITAGDTLVVTKLDRIARTAGQGIQLIDQLNKSRIRVNVLNMGIIDDSPTGKLIRNVMLCFAEFERDMIIERTQEGKRIAKNNPSYREGRPKKYSKTQIQHALELLKNHSYKQVTEMTGISRATLVRAKKEAENSEK